MLAGCMVHPQGRTSILPHTEPFSVAMPCKKKASTASSKRSRSARGAATGSQRRCNRSKLSILVVDNHPIVRLGLAEMINSEPDLKICGEAEGVSSALRALRKESFDLVIVDMSLSDGNGIELIEQIRSRNRRTRILAYSMHDDSIFAERALHAGALGYVNKSRSAETLLTAIRQVLRGEIAVTPAIAVRVMENTVEGRRNRSIGALNALSVRELDVLQLIGEGRTSTEIADQLCLSPKTIETHRAKIKQKLKLKNSAELARRAMQWVVLQVQPTSDG